MRRRSGATSVLGSACLKQRVSVIVVSMPAAAAAELALAEPPSPREAARAPSSAIAPLETEFHFGHADALTVFLLVKGGGEHGSVMNEKNKALNSRKPWLSER